MNHPDGSASAHRLKSRPLRKTKAIKVHLDRDHHDRLEQAAERYGMTVEALARQMIVDNLNRRR